MIDPNRIHKLFRAGVRVNQLRKLPELIESKPKEIAIGGGVLIGTFVLWKLWFSESALAAWMGTLIVWGMFYIGIALVLSNPSGWGKYLIMKTSQLTLDLVRVSYRVIFQLVAVALALIYFVFPIDIIPEFILLIGWIDDALIAWFLWKKANQTTMTIPQIALDDTYQSEPLKMHGLTAILSLLPVLFLRSLGG